MIFVTGGAGFIGSNLVRGLNRAGHRDILVVDDLEKGEKHLGLNGLEFADYIDYRDFLERLPGYKDVEVIFHQGACSDTMEADGRYMMRVNYEYSKELLAFCEQRACPFIYASSAATYGNGDNGFREERACEDPLNVYAFSKVLFDKHVRRVLPGAKCQIIGLRYFNVYGPQENHKGRMASVIFHFHNQIRGGGALKVFEGSENFRRDFVFVDDVVDVNLHFWANPEVSGIFNCGTGRAESFMELAEHVRSNYEGAEIQMIPFPSALEGKYQAFTQADLTNLRAAGYTREFTTLEQGVTAYVSILEKSGGYYRTAVEPAAAPSR